MGPGALIQRRTQGAQKGAYSIETVVAKSWPFFEAMSEKESREVGMVVVGINLDLEDVRVRSDLVMEFLILTENK